MAVLDPYMAIYIPNYSIAKNLLNNFKKKTVAYMQTLSIQLFKQMQIMNENRRWEIKACMSQQYT